MSLFCFGLLLWVLFSVCFCLFWGGVLGWVYFVIIIFWCVFFLLLGSPTHSLLLVCFGVFFVGRGWGGGGGSGVLIFFSSLGFF